MIEQARQIIREHGEITVHNLVFELCKLNDCFGDVCGHDIRNLGIETSEYPLYKLRRDTFYYTESQPVAEDII